jgi:hypothetical protein
MGLYHEGHPLEGYFHGDCAIIAVALADLTGKPLAAMLDHDNDLDREVLVHAFVSLDDNGAIFDAAGLSTIEHVRESFPNSGSPKTTPIGKDRLLSLAYTNDNMPQNFTEVLEIAKAVILQAIEEDPNECQRLGISLPSKAKLKRTA